MNLNEIQQKLRELNDWELKMDCLEKAFFMKTTQESKDFLNKILDIQEKVDHSPMIFIDRKIIKLTLDSGKEGITEKDFEFAKEIDKIQHS